MKLKFSKDLVIRNQTIIHRETLSEQSRKAIQIRKSGRQEMPKLLDIDMQ